MAKTKAKKPVKTKAKKAAKKAAKPAKAAKKPKPTRSAGKPTVVKAAPVAPAEGAAPKVLKPLTMKQRLSLIKIDAVTGKCPHGLAPETCSFCMSI